MCHSLYISEFVKPEINLITLVIHIIHTGEKKTKVTNLDDSSMNQMFHMNYCRVIQFCLITFA